MMLGMFHSTGPTASWPNSAPSWWAFLCYSVMSSSRLLSALISHKLHYLHRSRKKGQTPWHERYLFYFYRCRTPSASVLRQLKRYTAAYRLWQWQNRLAVATKAALHTSRFSFSTTRLLLVLLVVTYFSAAVASPDGVQLLQALTGNLAAWELSQLAGCRFR